jgi:hypothetical protein
MLRASAPIGSHRNKRNRSTMTSRLNPYQAAPGLMTLLFALDAIGSNTDHAQLNAPDASLGRAGGHSPGHVAAAPGAAEALIRVKAAGVAPWDAWIQTGKSTPPQPLPKLIANYRRCRDMREHWDVVSPLGRWSSSNIPESISSYSNSWRERPRLVRTRSSYGKVR